MKFSTFCSYLALFNPVIIFAVQHFFGIVLPPEILQGLCPTVAAGGGVALHMKASPIGK